MQIFIDSADAAELKTLAQTGLVDGVTTNPSLVAKAGRDFFETLAEICAAVPGPVSAEVVAQDAETMIKEGLKLRGVAPNIVVKVPLTPEGLKACKHLEDNGHPTNVTLCFSAVQALLAAKAGATFISPFIGRLDDNGQDGMELIREIRAIFDNYDYQARHLVLVRLAPHGFRLRLHATDRAIHHACAIEHAHRALDLDREVDVAGGVDDVHPVLGELAVHALPEAGRGGRGDRDAALALLLHPVHDGRAVVHLAQLVGDAGVEEDPLRRRGLAGVDVRRDPDVPVAFDGGLASHDLDSLP